MKTKKKLLFVIESLTLAGSEKSLIALLSNIDPKLYDVDLQLFKYGGELERFIPNYIHQLKPLAYTEFAKQSTFKNIKSGNIKSLIAKIRFSISLRMGKRNHSEIATLYWKYVKGVIFNNPKVYDVAIAFAQGVPTFYVMDKVKAKKKVTWVNANMQFTPRNIDFQKQYYSQYDTIVAISKGTKKHLEGIFPELLHKYKVIPNIIDSKTIPQMAALYNPPMDASVYNILTVGRLDDGMKGMDITIEACKELRNRGVNLHWYIVGEGAFRNEMEEFIESNELQNQVSLLGSTDNPYPYFKAADLYVQTSRHEGYGRTIAEARMLNLPIVTTNFDTVGLQIEHKKNGIITAINAKAVADGIVEIMNDPNLYETITENLKKEPKENTETIQLFDQLMEIEK